MRNSWRRVYQTQTSLKVEPADSGHLNAETKLAGIASLGSLMPVYKPTTSNYHHLRFNGRFPGEPGLTCSTLVSSSNRSGRDPLWKSDKDISPHHRRTQAVHSYLPDGDNVYSHLIHAYLGPPNCKGLTVLVYFYFLLSLHHYCCISKPDVMIWRQDYWFFREKWNFEGSLITVDIQGFR